MSETIMCNTINGYPYLIMINRIIYLSKSNDSDITFIHLDNGEILKSSDSIKTIEAKIYLSKN